MLLFDFSWFHLLVSTAYASKAELRPARLCLQKNYQNFDGFVILHGTDTMAYTASALSFMCEHLGKPIILTGSQVKAAGTKPTSARFLQYLSYKKHYVFRCPSMR